MNGWTSLGQPSRYSLNSSKLLMPDSVRLGIETSMIPSAELVWGMEWGSRVCSRAFMGGTMLHELHQGCFAALGGCTW